LSQQMIAALTAAAPVYRAHWWPADDRANRDWIEQVSVQVEKWGVRVAQQLAGAYQAPWPRGRLAVDIVGYAGPLGAYTTLEPLHLTISSRDPRNQGFGGLGAFEVLFHEASHGVAGNLQRAIIRQCRDEGKLIPRDLWHATLFYTTGEVVKREVDRAAARDAVSGNGSGEEPADQAYDQRYALFTRGWSNYLTLLETYWQPYLDGQVSFERAVENMVSAL
jgi:hypothetical protein